MRLTRRSEIAIGILLACMEKDLTSIRDAAEHCGTTKQNASHVTAELVRAGLLISQTGQYGGIGLARSAGDIRLGEVLRLTQPDLDPAGPDPNALRFPTVSGASAFAGLIRTATGASLAVLNQFTLADLVDGEGRKPMSADRRDALSLSDRHESRRL